MKQGKPITMAHSEARPRLSLVRPEKFPAIDTFDQLPIVIAHDSAAQSAGKGLTLAQRKRSALGEWVERRCLYSATPERYASVRDLGAACLPPPLFGLDLPQEAPELVLPYDPQRVVGWVPVTSAEGVRRWLHQPGWNQPGFYRPTSNGAAVHSSRQAALASAVAELLERHAFVAWWYGLASSQPLAVPPGPGPWRRLVAWFTDRGWELTAHLLPVFTSLPVVLVAAIRRANSGTPLGGVIGLGTGAASTDPVNSAVATAALEVLQAVESFSLLRAAGKIVTGDLARYLVPAGAQEIDDRLWSADAVERDAHRQWLGCPITAARDAEIGIWISDRRSTETVANGMYWVQVFSPDTLPFPSTERGRRLDHPVLRGYLDRWGRWFTSVPPLPHPLG